VTASRPKSKGRLTATLRLIAAILGVAILVFVAVMAAFSWNGAATITFAAVAVLLLAAAIFYPRLSNLTLGVKVPGFGEITLNAELTAELQRDLDYTGLGGAAAIYAFVRGQLSGRDVEDLRIHLQDQLVESVKDLPTTTEQLDQALSGSAAQRTLAFGVIKGNPELATVPRLIQGITESASGNEQYHALLAAESNWDQLTPEEKVALRAAIDTAPRWRADHDRRVVARRILKRPVT
jgi:hypothetical protein